MYTPNNAGCYGDGAFGHAHIRRNLADFVESLARVNHDAKARAAIIIPALREDMSDDASEEDDAIDLLNELACIQCHFEMVDGDLVLMPDETEVTT